MKQVAVVILVVAGAGLFGLAGLGVLSAIAIPAFTNAHQVEQVGQFDSQGIIPPDAIHVGAMTHQNWLPIFTIGAGLLFVLAVIIIGVLSRAFLPSAGQARQREEEAEMIRQLWEMMERMDQRIIHLETILLERRS